MNLHRLLADYRKTLRRLRRRALFSSARQVQAWKRRLSYLRERLRLAPGLRLRHAAMAAAMLGLSASASAGSSITSNAKFVGHQDGLIEIPKRDNNSGYSVAALGDIDGDGDLDAVVYSEYYAQFFRNTGTSKNPVWEEQTGSANPFDSVFSNYYNSYYSSIALVDIDGDGDLDLVMGNEMRFFENTGSKTNAVFTQRYGAANPFYALYQAAEYYSGESANRFTFGDFDHDGDIDLIYTNGGYWQYYGLGFYKNIGSKSSPDFQLQTGAADPFSGVSLADCLFPVAVDVDHDGDLDLITGSYNYDELRLLKNVGSASAPSFTDTGELPGLYSYNPIISGGDVDGDGDVDLLEGSRDAWLAVLQNVNGKFSETLRAEYESGYTQNQFVDIDGDGDLDFAGPRWWNLRNDNGVMQYVGYLSGSWNSDNGWVFNDIDGDGDKDLINWNYGYPSLSRNNGSGVFTSDNSSSSPFYSSGYNPMGGGTVWGAMGDVDGDGDTDLLMVSQYYNSHRFYRNDGGAFVLVTGPTDPFDNLSGSYQKPYLVDIDGDGDLDLISFDTYYGTSHQAFRNDAPGTPMVALTGSDNPLQGLILNDGYGYGTNQIYSTDIDGDGDLDFKVFFYGYHTWFTLKNNIPRFGVVNPLSAEKNKILIGPVPAKVGDPLCLYVDRATDDLDVTVFNAAGEVVSSGVFVKGTQGCITATMAPGLYWARIKSESRTFTQKLIINAK
jgi:hypothetical protein